jgi:glycosyltransferase involved in cell wall biosynthesis
MKLLFIPHVPNLSVINRVYEFAKNSDSYFLTWNIDNSSLKAKISSQFHSLQFREEDNLVQIPLLFKPDSLAPKFNTFMLNRLLKKLEIDAVVNANALLFDIKSICVPVIYDLVDDHLEINDAIGLNKRRIQKIKEDVKNSVGVICVTSFVEKKAKLLHKNTTTIENGVYIERFLKASSLREKLGLTGKMVYGYIGGVEPWTGLREACESYRKIVDETNAFIVVGGSESSYYKSLVKEYATEILFVGRVAPTEVADYFKTIDRGLIPFELNPFTNNALPIKALEYALAGADVLATKIHYLEHKNYPFVHFCERENFTKGLLFEKREWEYDFNHLDWSYLAKDVKKFVGESI